MLNNKTIHLTKKEITILRLLATGRTSREIAVKLRLTPGTVGVNRARLNREFQVHNVTELIQAAREAGYLSK